MPSPLGHALAGLAAGWLVEGPGAERDADPDRSGANPQRGADSVRTWRRAAAFAALGMAADLDLLVGRHSQFTHSVGAALIVLAAAAWLLRGRPAAWRLALAAGAAYASHILLDWLGQDATPPFGITALWPFSRAFYLSHADLFWGISRQPWKTGAVWHDVVSVAREVAILGPVAAAAWWRHGGWRNLRTRRSDARQDLRSVPAPDGRGERSTES